jgi:hypothetical protein
MATKGDISDLNELVFGGKYMIPTVDGFNRIRKSGVITSNTAGGASRQRKKYHNMPHSANVTFCLDSAAQQDYMQLFIDENEGKYFICHLAADRPLVEPYVCQAIGDWTHIEVNSKQGKVTCVFEIISVRDIYLDDFLKQTYSCMGDDLCDFLTSLEDLIKEVPVV